MNTALIAAIASKTIFNSINSRRLSPVKQGEDIKRYDVYLHIETVHGQFNDIYSVNAHNEKEAVSLAITRFRSENDCSGVTLIQALEAIKCN